MNALKQFFDFIPEKILKSIYLKIFLVFSLVSIAALFEKGLRFVDPRASIFFFYPLVIVSLVYVHAPATIVVSALFLQFFVLAKMKVGFVYPDDLIIQIVFLLSNLMLYRFSNSVKAEVQKVQKELEEEMSSRLKFTSTLGQLIRSSTSLLKTGGLFMKEQSPESEKFKKALALVMLKGDQLDNLMKDVVNVSILASGEKLDFHTAEVSLRTIVNEMAASFEANHPGKIVLDIKSPGIRASWNEEAMRRVVYVLCSNAIVHGNEKPVTLSFVEDDNHASITVQNFGTPISEKDLKELFLPFRSMLQMRPGTEIKPGLSLTVVKGIIEAHGGNLKVVSNTVEGTIFQVLLPRRVKAP
jgi:signal transduction histidine kinase